MANPLSDWFRRPAPGGEGVSEDPKVRALEAEVARLREQQRRWVNVLVDDAGELRTRAAASFDEVRGLIDAALARLTVPAEGGARMLDSMDAEVDRIGRAVEDDRPDPRG